MYGPLLVKENILFYHFFREHVWKQVQEHNHIRLLQHLHINHLVPGVVQEDCLFDLRLFIFFNIRDAFFREKCVILGDDKLLIGNRNVQPVRKLFPALSVPIHPQTAVQLTVQIRTLRTELFSQNRGQSAAVARHIIGICVIIHVFRIFIRPDNVTDHISLSFFIPLPPGYPERSRLKNDLITEPLHKCSVPGNTVIPHRQYPLSHDAL